MKKLQQLTKCYIKLYKNENTFAYIHIIHTTAGSGCYRGRPLETTETQ